MSIGAYVFAACLYSIFGALDFFMGMNSYKEGKYFGAGMWFTVWVGLMIVLAKLILEN